MAQPSCAVDLWPVYAGSSDYIDKTTCMSYDNTNDVIIVGGTALDQTEGSNFQQIGFLYALDLNANWMWGGTIFHTNETLSEINSCRMNSEHDLLVVFGIMN